MLHLYSTDDAVVLVVTNMTFTLQPMQRRSLAVQWYGVGVMEYDQQVASSSATLSRALPV